MEHRKTANAQVIFGLTLVNFVGYFYASFMYPLLPVFVERFFLTLTQVGLISGVSRLVQCVVQPSVGYIADHYRTRFFILGGTLLTIVFMPLVGIAPSFFVLILFVSLGSIGSSMFYPTSVGMVFTYAERHFGFSMSMLEMGGVLGFALGPLFIAYFVSSYGLWISPFTMIFGLALMAFFIRIIPVPQEAQLEKLGLIDSIKEILGKVWKSILLIWVVLALRTFVSQSFSSFVPVMYANQGYSLVSIGIIVSLFTVGGAIGCPLAGHLAERIGYRPVLCLAHTLTTPSLYLLLYLAGNWVYLSAFLAGFFLFSTLPLWVAMAQELAPKARSTVSGLIVGLSFGSGGMMIPLAGKLADILSIRTALAFLAIIPFLTIALIFLIPQKR